MEQDSSQKINNQQGKVEQFLQVEDIFNKIENDVSIKTLNQRLLQQMSNPNTLEEEQKIQHQMGGNNGTQPYEYRTINFPNSRIPQSVIQKVSQKYPIIYDVRGDGNCFYRSVILHYLIKIFKPCEYNRFPQCQIETILNFMKEVDSINLRPKKTYSIRFQNNFYPFSTQQLKDIFLRQIYNYFQEFIVSQNVLETIINDLKSNISFDISSVAICRLLIYQTFILQKFNPQLNQLRNDLSMIDNLILEYGTQAEDNIIKLAAEAFKSQLVIQNLYVDYDNNQKVVSEEHVFGPLKDYQDPSNIAVLYTNGHYQCLIDKEYTEKKECSKDIVQSNEVSQKQIPGGIQKNCESIQKQEKSMKQDEYIDIDQMKNQQFSKDEQKQIQEYFKQDMCIVHNQSIEAYQKLKLISNKQQYFICTSCLKEELENNKELKRNQYFQIKFQQIKKQITFLLKDNNQISHIYEKYI